MGGGAGHALGHGPAVPARVLHFQAGGAGITQGMSRKENCIDNAATEQFFGHVKDTNNGNRVIDEGYRRKCA